MVEKDPQLRALDFSELDMFVENMEPSQILNIGNHA